MNRFKIILIALMFSVSNILSLSVVPAEASSASSATETTAPIITELKVAPPSDENRSVQFSEVFTDFKRPDRNPTEPVATAELDVSCTPVTTQSVSNKPVSNQKIDLGKVLNQQVNAPAASDSALESNSHCSSELTTSVSERPDFTRPEQRFEIDIKRQSPAEQTSSPVLNTVTLSPQVKRSPGPFRVTSVRPYRAVINTAYPLNRNIVVTFSEPMVDTLETNKQITTKIPIQLTPLLPGKFYWFDQQTLIFTPKSAILPAATAFRVVVPKTTKSLAGRILAAAQTYQFQTNRPEVSLGTGMPQGVVVAHFEQQIKPSSLISRITASVNGRPISLRPATDVETKEIYGGTVYKNQRFAFYPIGAKPDDEILVEVQPGVESMEGPLRSIAKGAQKVKLGTARGHFFRKDVHQYEPGQPIEILLNSQLADRNDTNNRVSVTPPIENLKVHTYNQILVLTGRTKPDTTYRVDIDLGLKGQDKNVVRRDESIPVIVGSYKARLLPPEDVCAKLDAAVSTRFKIQSINMPKIKATVYATDNSIVRGHQSMYRTWQAKEKPILEKIIETNGEHNQVAVSDFDLKEVVEKGHKKFVVKIEDAATTKNIDTEYPVLAKPRVCRSYIMWLEVTNLSLTTIPTRSAVVCLVTDSSTGRPVEGAKVFGFPADTKPPKDYFNKSETASPLDFAVIANARKKRLEGTTDANGICQLAFPQVFNDTDNADHYSAFIAEKNSAQSFTHLLARSAIKSPMADFLWNSNIETYQCLRGKPVKFWGWVKGTEGYKLRDADLKNHSIVFSVFDSQSQKLSDGSCPVSSNGGFLSQFTLASGAACGAGKLKIQLKDSNGKILSETDQQFEVAEPKLRDGDFMVTLDKKAAFIGDPVSASVTAMNTGGQPMQKSPVEWRIFTSPTEYTPPGWTDFTFSCSEQRNISAKWKVGDPVKTVSDAEGCCSVILNPKSAKDPLPVVMAVQASEVRTGSAARNMTQSNFCLIHSRAYVGMNAVREIRDGKQNVSVRAVVTAPDGKVIPDKKVTITVSRLKGIDYFNRLLPAEVIAQTDLVSRESPEIKNIQLDEIVPVHVAASIYEDGKVVHQCSKVLGGSHEWSVPENNERLTVITDKESYASGDTCRLYLTCPLKEASGIAVIDTASGAVAKPIAIKDQKGVVDFAIGTATSALGGVVKVYGLREDGGATSSAQLFQVKVGEQRKMLVHIQPASSLPEIGKELPVDVTLKLSDGKPASDAEVVVSIFPDETLNDGHFDRSLFGLTEYQSSQSGMRSNDFFRPLDSVRFLGLDNQVELPVEEPRGHGCGFGAGAGPYPVCRATADDRAVLDRAVSSIVRTDERGCARVSIRVPEHAGRYRIRCDAVGGILCGETFARVDAIEPISVTGSVPKGIVQGDEYSDCIEIRNIGALEIDMNLRLTSEAKSIHFSKDIKVMSGITHVEIASAQLAPDLKIELSNGSQKWNFTNEPDVKALKDTKVIRYYGSVNSVNRKIALTETNKMRLTDVQLVSSNSRLALIIAALEEMCSRQNSSSIHIASRAIALLSFHQLCKKIGRSDLSNPYEAILREDVCQLSKNYSANRGWISWLPEARDQGSRESSSPALLTTYALFFANQEGFNVDEHLLRGIQNEMGMIYVNEDTPEAKLNLKKEQSFAYYVFSNYEQDPLQKKYIAQTMEHFLQAYHIARLADEELGWLCLAANKVPIDKHLNANLNNRFDQFLKESSASATPTKDSDKALKIRGITYSSATTGDAVIALALMNRDAGTASESNSGKTLLHGDVLNELLRRIEQRGSLAKWESPSASAMATMALCQSLMTNNVSSKGQVRVSFSNSSGSAEIDSRIKSFDPSKPEIFEVDVPVSKSKSKHETVLLTSGLNFGVKAVYSFDAKGSSASNNGIGIRRMFTAMDEKSKVWRDAEGNWHCLVGSNILGNVSFVPSKRVDRVMLTDMIAGGFGAFELGFEPGNLSMGPQPWDKDPCWEEYDPWPQEIERKGTNLRFFASAVGPRLYECTYKLHATNPGKFFIPPASIESVFDDSASGTTAGTTFFVHSTTP